MANSLQIHRLAITEAANARLWYEDQLPGLGLDFVQELQDAINQITVKPLLYARVSRSYRQIQLGRFPYVVVYEYLASKQLIYISSVRHMRQSNRGKFRRREK